jgi:DNA helicase-2/ATP-dependent DNA helicase PcrA
MSGKEVEDLLTAPQRTAETGSGDLGASPDGLLAGPDALLATLDPEQQQVVLASRGPVCVLAGAGTGKTRAVTHRIAYAVATGVVSPDRVLAVTFTTRAAGELRARLRQLGAAVPGAGLDRVQALTFHSAALRQLTHFWPSAVGGPAPRVLDSKVPLIAEAARQLRVTAGSAELRDIATEIEWAKVSQVRPEGYAEASVALRGTLPIPPDQLSRVYAAYEELRRARNLVDFESVLELTAALLAETPAAAASVRDRYAYFTVDEYQDINPLQKLLLDVWLGGRDDVCVVGDPRQTIYSFTGASPAFLTGFGRQFPSATVIRLVRNYRSSPQVVALANRVSGLAAGRPPGGLVSRLTRAGAAAPDALIAQRPAGPEPGFEETGDEDAEAAMVARRAAALIAAGLPASDIAVLVRINAQTPLLEQALADAGVPFQVRGAERFFDRPEVKMAVAHLRAAAKSASAPDDPASQVRPILAGLGLTAEPPGGRGRAREKWESLQALAQLADDFFAAHAGASLPDLAAELRHRSASGQVPRLDGVTLASLHAAKGLEWEAVFMPGLTEGMLPIIYAQTDEAVEEERRLFYVGVTRARHRLHLSWALARTPGGRASRKPSRFIDGLRTPGRRAGAVPGASARAGAGPGSEGRRGTARGAGAGAGDPGSPLFLQLREWRREAAREQSVPAFVIFSDAALARIADARPGSLAALAAIPGVGQAKLDRYGAAVIALCAPRAGTEGAVR